METQSLNAAEAAMLPFIDDNEVPCDSVRQKWASNIKRNRLLIELRSGRFGRFAKKSAQLPIKVKRRHKARAKRIN